eukprot:1845172-Amphidinium_carterae.1
MQVAAVLVYHFMPKPNKYEGYIVALVEQSVLLDSILQEGKDYLKLKGRALQGFSDGMLHYKLLFTALSQERLDLMLFGFTIE